ncbi:hypothetical protein BC829DRAFT_432739 [Chytridium lagenaria]|nr:hypothetical protein BC829DRAFT_432739 [Chytridium lagenaria]
MVDYEHFLSQLRQEEAMNLTAQLKSFLKAFHAQQRPIPEQRKAVARFLEHIYGESLQNAVFAEATEDDELENIREGWEKLLMIKIYDQVFGAPGTDENKMTQYLTRKIEQFSWIQERHLDLPFQMGASLEVAQGELLRVNGFRCPKDKLTILQNVMQLITDLIQKQQQHANSDHLLPVLILAVIRSNPPALISNVKYIMRFRSPTDIEKGTVQFCLTSMMGAVSFIYNMKISSLTLSPEELRQYGGKLQAPPPRTHSRSELPSNTPPPLPPRASSNVTQSNGALATSPPTSSKVNEIATTFYSSTLKMFDSTATAIKTVAETAAVTVDGFAQGLIERFKEDGKPVGSNSSLNTSSTSSLADTDSAAPPAPLSTTDKSWTSKLITPAINPQINARPGSSATALTAPLVPAISPTPNSAYPGSVTPPEDLYAQNTYERFANAKDRETFEAALSDAERGVLEDYELQLALALSMSIEDRRAAGIDIPPSPTKDTPGQEGILIDLDEKPKEPPGELEISHQASPVTPSVRKQVNAGGSFVEEDDDFEIPLKSPAKKKSLETVKATSSSEGVLIDAESAEVQASSPQKTALTPTSASNEESLI